MALLSFRHFGIACGNCLQRGPHFWFLRPLGLVRLGAPTLVSCTQFPMRIHTPQNSPYPHGDFRVFPLRHYLSNPPCMFSSDRLFPFFSALFTLSTQRRGLCCITASSVLHSPRATRTTHIIEHTYMGGRVGSPSSRGGKNTKSTKTVDSRRLKTTSQKRTKNGGRSGEFGGEGDEGTTYHTSRTVRSKPKRTLFNLHSEKVPHAHTKKMVDPKALLKAVGNGIEDGLASR
ncbi:hypothetical protein HDK77DRAFT_217035 [Phyllosticta capitalensis]